MTGTKHSFLKFMALTAEFIVFAGADSKELQIRFASTHHNAVPAGYVLT